MGESALPAEPTRSRPSGYLPTLDGWRAVAIGGVLIAHGGPAIVYQDGLFPNALLYAIGSIGSKGVDLFFAISGYLITSRLLEEYRKTGRVSLRDFYIRRAFRILPPFLVYLAAVGIAVLLGFLVISPKDLLMSATFTRNYYTPWPGNWYTGHLWSLAVEEHFYLLWPGLLVLVGVRRSLSWAIAISLLVCAWAIVDWRVKLLEEVLPGVAFDMRTDICLSKLLIAAAAAIAVEFHPVFMKRLIQPWMTGPLAFALFAVIWMEPHDARYGWFSESLLFTLLITSTVLLPTTLVGRILELGFLRWIGRISYSLYLWQQLFLLGLDHRNCYLIQKLPWNVLATFACAIASYHFVERPMIHLGRRFAPPVSTGQIKKD